MNAPIRVDKPAAAITAVKVLVGHIKFNLRIDFDRLFRQNWNEYIIICGKLSIFYFKIV
ncbi:hypothetical protein CE91St65_24350 [[Clostridium] symbiosum]|nr:hypothetical protein CE91St65_24350 [[Clostridium] symbiosum]BDF29460.1 hypothetical protein CE91St66_24370 [[Clostridium] symbiosum]